MREFWLVNGTLVRWRCSLPHGFCASEPLTGINRPGYINYRYTIVGHNPLDNELSEGVLKAQ
jgi:hypothetical protein